MAKKIEYKGIVYGSVKELANEFGISPNTLTYRMKQGLSLEEALSTKRKKRVESPNVVRALPSTSVAITYNGKNYKSLGQLCREFNVPLAVFSKRKSRGYSIDECINGKSKNKIHYKNESYDSISELCKELKLNFNAITGRIRRGKTLEEAIEGKGNIGKYQIEFEGVIYNSEKEMCDAFNVNYATYKARKHNNWALNERIYGKVKSR